MISLVFEYTFATYEFNLKLQTDATKSGYTCNVIPREPSSFKASFLNILEN
jgi:hypothetical protein